jgi:hypothetical protein
MLYWAIQLLEFGLGYAGLLSVFAGVWVFESLSKSRLSPALEWSLFGGAFLAISFRNWHRANSRARDAERAAAKKQEAAKRVYAGEPEALLAHLRDPRRFSEIELTCYLEEWLMLSGIVEGVAESLVGDAIYLTLILERGQRINLRFAADDRKQIEKLRVGQVVTAAGQIRGAFPKFTLENCELLRVAPVRAGLARVS